MFVEWCFKNGVLWCRYDPQRELHKCSKKELNLYISIIRGQNGELRKGLLKEEMLHGAVVTHIKNLAEKVGLVVKEVD